MKGKKLETHQKYDKILDFELFNRKLSLKQTSQLIIAKTWSLLTE